MNSRKLESEIFDNGATKKHLFASGITLYMIPRISIRDFKNDSKINQIGVYFLIGQDETPNLKVYVGEAEKVYDRINSRDHLAKEFWTFIVCVFCYDFNKAHIKYLENLCWNSIKEADRYILDNKNIPTKSPLKSGEGYEIERVFEEIKLVFRANRFYMFDKIETINEIKKETEAIEFHKEICGMDMIYYCNQAKGKFVEDGFVVFKDSQCRLDIVKSFYKNRYNTLRENLIKNNIIIKENNKLFFTEDYIFTSPSSAASVVSGASSNGRADWKTQDGKTINEVESIIN